MKYIKLIIIATCLSGCFSKKPKITGYEGKPMPSFKLLLPDSISIFDTKDIPKGKPSVLFCFSPSCSYCKAQMDEIIEDNNLLKDINFYIFTSSPYNHMKSFYNHYQLNKYPNIIVGRDLKNFFGEYFDIKGVPYLAIYDKDKRLNKVFAGKIYGKQLKKEAFN